MSGVIEAFLVVIGFEEREALPRSLHPLKPNSAWSSGECVFGIGPRRWTELQNLQWGISHLFPRLVSLQRRSLAQSKVA
ncbi:hypothetical protein EFV37_32990 [Mesorhizobium loti]|nr:hypothetical protein A9174_32265 [Mesorhizobium loti NZP2037]OBP77973.1 hypothetical protein BAE41_30955 [Mesorhizobium loti]QKC66485.1 hypothetical protein EB229_32985 [Mesorhizobium jarvisii]OBP96974.1 hypothetical protein BAE38_27205 [Mesorhizobium loti]OBQ73552.1 hypothetical protein A9K72_31100 [Mesorhizobium loti]